MNNAIWITWENQIRNRSMSDMLGVRLITIICRGNRFKRYSFCLFLTFITLLKERPKIVFAQNPSIILNYFLIFARLIFRYKLVSDAHFAGVIAFNGSKIIQKALDICNRLANLVIVTNEEHNKYICGIGGRAIICEDPLPDISIYFTDEAKTEKTVFYICSYDVDEPYDLAFKASDILLKDNFKFLVTGNYKKVGINPEEYPNVIFLGYLPEVDYYTRLFQSNIVLDLTESENCLVCGAYESMAAEKPLVTSDTVCLRNYFKKGTVFTRHDEMSIANAIRLGYQERKRLINEIIEWKNMIYDYQKQRADNINRELGLTL
jgi:glycosyltransferase involved in cell wall biosynthesis